LRIAVLAVRPKGFRTASPSALVPEDSSLPRRPAGAAGFKHLPAPRGRRRHGAGPAQAPWPTMGRRLPGMPPDQPGRVCGR